MKLLMAVLALTCCSFVALNGEEATMPKNQPAKDCCTCPAKKEQPKLALGEKPAQGEQKTGALPQEKKLVAVEQKSVQPVSPADEAKKMSSEKKLIAGMTETKKEQPKEVEQKLIAGMTESTKEQPKDKNTEKKLVAGMTETKKDSAKDKEAEAKMVAMGDKKEECPASQNCCADKKKEAKFVA